MIHADDVEGKVAVVTGSSSGIGRALAVALAGEGMRVVVNGRAAERLEAVTTEIKQGGAEVLAVDADLSYPEGARLLVDRTVATSTRYQLRTPRTSASWRRNPGV